MTSKMDLSPYHKLMDTAPRMLGRDPWTPDGSIYIRKSDEVPQGHQVFAKATGNPAVPDVGGNLLAVDHIVTPRPDLVGKFDTIVLHPMDYEAVKKCMMEAPRKDAARKSYGRKQKLDLTGFDPSKAWKH